MPVYLIYTKYTQHMYVLLYNQIIHIDREEWDVQLR